MRIGGVQAVRAGVCAALMLIPACLSGCYAIMFYSAAILSSGPQCHPLDNNRVVDVTQTAMVVRENEIVIESLAVGGSFLDQKIALRKALLARGEPWKSLISQGLEVNTNIDLEPLFIEFNNENSVVVYGERTSVSPLCSGTRIHAIVVNQRGSEVSYSRWHKPVCAPDDCAQPVCVLLRSQYIVCVSNQGVDVFDLYTGEELGRVHVTANYDTLEVSTLLSGDVVFRLSQRDTRFRDHFVSPWYTVWQ